MWETLKKIFESILSIFTKKEKDNKSPEEVKGIKKSNHKYEDDLLIKAKSYDTKLFEKNMAVIHFSWTKDLDTLSNYFSKWIPKNTANSTWGIGKEGKIHRYLPDIKMPSWTNNAVWNNKGVYAKFTDLQGKWKTGRYVNNHSCAFEVVNINYKEYTEKQYAAVAELLLMMLEILPDFRIWRITGHSHLTPIAKDDPGTHWNWQHLLVDHIGLDQRFYDTYLSYLQDTAYSTVGDVTRTALKWQLIKQGVEKLNDLKNEPKEFGFK